MSSTGSGEENHEESANREPSGQPRDSQHTAGGGEAVSTRSVSGHVLGFDRVAGTGAISGEDGERYHFISNEWRAQNPPAEGMSVDFVPEDHEARAIYRSVRYSTSGAVSPSYGAAGSKSKVAAGLLAILLGWLGIHKFYLGYTWPGIILLLAGTIGWAIVIPPIVAAIIGIIEGVLYLTKSDEEFERLYVQGKQEWF